MGKAGAHLATGLLASSLARMRARVLSAVCRVTSGVLRQAGGRAAGGWGYVSRAR